MLGYGLAGLGRRFLVWPAAMIWPTNLVNTSLFYTLHDHSPADPSKTGGWSIGRYRYFSYVFIGSFIWYWFPGWIFQALSTFAFVTWIRPNNVVINQLFGASTGLSLIPITFDWTQVTGFLLSPLIPPWVSLPCLLLCFSSFAPLDMFASSFATRFWSAASRQTDMHLGFDLLPSLF